MWSKVGAIFLLPELSFLADKPCMLWPYLSADILLLTHSLVFTGFRTISCVLDFSIYVDFFMPPTVQG